jgi:mono/diheme cytochrome c family protein
MQIRRKFFFGFIPALVLSAWLVPLAFEVSAQEGSEEWEPGRPLGWNFKNLSPEQQQRMLRFSTFVNKGVPEDYLKAENTVGYTTKAIAAGGPLYVTHCAKCHGESGLGNGELAYVLTPSPALLAYTIQQPIAIDQYLLWSISEGGKQFDTAMPSFKNELTQEQIWQIVAYLRASFPAVEDAPKPSSAPPAKTDDPSLKPKSGN